jgi:thioredoxin reductase (NADPH)
MREDSLDVAMSQYLIDQISEVPNIEVIPNVEVLELCGDERLASAQIKVAGNPRHVPADAMFVFIGAVPRTDWLEGRIARDRDGYVLSGGEVQRKGLWHHRRPPMPLESSIPGVFVAGDVRAGSVKRVANSVGAGSIAVHMVHEYLAELRA